MKQPDITIKLIGITAGIGLTAEQLLVYTKSTRLEQGTDTRNRIKAMTKEEIDKELDYMADTIPSSWEFIDFTFEIKNVTRAFTHQLVRTRTGSYAQQTMRMLDKRGFTYRVPPRLMSSDRVPERTWYERCMADIQKAYDALVAAGVPAEDARGVLPTNIHTNIIAKFNLRTLAEMARSRTGARTQDEYREVMDLALDAVVKECPWAHRFLFPESNKHAKALEELLKRLVAFGSVPPEERTAAFKHLDALRKGAS